MMSRRAVVALLSAAIPTACAAPALAQETFTYQGKLADTGATLPGSYEFWFRMYDDLAIGAPDTQIGGSQFFTGAGAVNVAEDGTFTVPLSFGAGNLENGPRFLQISVRRSAADPWTTLTPRQPLTEAPRAHYAAQLDLPFSQFGPPAAPNSATFFITNSSASGAGLGGRGPTWGIVGSSGDLPSWWPVVSPAGVHGVGEAVGVGGSSHAGSGTVGLSVVGIAGQFDIPWNSALPFDTAPSIALSATNQGFGRGAVIELTNPSNVRSALEATTAGSGRAGAFLRTATTGSAAALYASTSSTSSSAYAVHGEITSTNPGGFSAAVRGENNGTAGLGIGVYGSQNGSGWGVHGTSTSGRGVSGLSTSGVGVYGQAGGAGLAGQFAGNVQISGNLSVSGTVSKGGGTFRIDHPLDPTNKYLVHSFVESPEMKNVYDGTAVLDDHGRAIVTLPSYFEALNGDFRYQLTCIGGYAPVYIAREVSDNSFEIAGGSPGLKVSWQVTGIRNDAFARKHRFDTEVEKPASERGAYLHPEAFERE